jgi:hypothetical protein
MSPDTNAEQPKTDREWLIRIDGTVDQLLICQEDHETRIRAVEGSFFKVMSIAGFIGFLSGWFGRMFGGS